MATRSARCRWASAGPSPRPTSPCCSMSRVFLFPPRDARDETLDALEAQCRAGQAAALIVEPLVLGAGGMLMYPAAVLAQLRAICARHGVLFIADEVMTGWGRTGSMFACEQAGIAPDIACYSKGLTGGSLPLAVTLCRREIFAAHYALGSAPHLLSLELVHGQSDRLRRGPRQSGDLGVRARTRAHRRACKRCKQSGWSASGRCSLRAGAPDGHHHGHGRALDRARLLRRAGTAARGLVPGRRSAAPPLGNTLYVLPPYCVTADDLDRVYDAILAAVDALG